MQHRTSRFIMRRGLMAVGAVIEIAMRQKKHPLCAKAIASRIKLPNRYLEAVLQALTREEILVATRGPRGGYELNREGVTVEEILKIAKTLDDNQFGEIGSMIIDKIVAPALAFAEDAFSEVLKKLTVETLVQMVKEKTDEYPTGPSEGDRPDRKDRRERNPASGSRI